MKSIITLGGSSSSKSINKQLAEYAGSLVNGVEVKNLDLNDYQIPIYSIDEEKASGFSDDLLKLDAQIEEADGVILSLAEHNGAYTAVFKNIFDWLSRVESKNWRGKPMLLLSTSPGPRGGLSVLEMALQRFPRHEGNIIFSMSFPSFSENFKEGKVVNEDLKKELFKGIEILEKSI